MTTPRTRTFFLPLLAAWILAACTGTSPTPPGTSSPPAKTLTPSPVPSVTSTRMPPIQIDPASLRGVSLQVWHAFTGPAGDAFTDQAALFNTVNPWGILVYPQGYGDYTTLFEAVNAGLESGAKPELVAALPEQILTWDASQAIVDLNPYLGDPALGLKDSELADIPSVFLAQEDLNGRRLGVPALRSARFVFYNKTWANVLGFTHPPETSDEFRQQACAANASFRKDAFPQNDGYGGWVVDPAWQTTLSWMLAFGGGAVEDGAYRFRSDQNLSALQFLKILYDDKCAWLSTDPTPFDSFARRSALFVTADLAEVPLAAEAMGRAGNADEWTVLPFPGPEKSALLAYGPDYALLVSTPGKQLAAWLFARWLLSPESQAQWAQGTGSLPLRSSALDALEAYRLAQPQWEAAVGCLSQMQATPRLASWRKVRFVLEDGAQSIFRVDLAAAQIPSVLAQMDALGEELNK